MRVMAWITVALVAAPVLAQEQTQEKSATAVFEKLSAEFAKARSEYISETQAKNERLDLAIPAAPFLPHFHQAAKDYAGTEDAVPFLSWIVMNGTQDKEMVIAAVDEILALHVESAQLVSIANGVDRMGGIVGEERAAELKSQLMAKGHPEVKGTMLFFSGYMALMDRNASAEATEAALKDLRQAAKLEGQYAGMAEGMLFERENLQIGMEAPDIVGEDLDGVNFSLSDYRGKVVVIDFWGDW